MMGWIFAGGILFGGSIYDVKSCCLPLWLVVCSVVGGVAGLFCACINGECDWLEVFIRLLPGVLSVCLAFITKEQIGYGDGLLLLMLGGCVGGEATWGIWFGGLLVSFLVSVILLVLRKAGKNTKIPFVPCMFLGYIVIGVGGISSVL